MKTVHLSIIVTVIGILIIPSIQDAMGIPYMSPQELYKLSDMVFHGQVISKQAGPGPDYYYYQIKVDTYFKNPQNSDSITAADHKPDNPRAGYPQFEVGDKAIFYIRNIEGINTIYPNSQKAGNACDIHSFLGTSPFPEGEAITMPASNPRLVDADGNAIVGSVSTNQKIMIYYDEIWNNYPEERIIPVKESIVDSNSQTVFNKTQNFDMLACDGPSTASINFVPTQSGNYVAAIVIDNKTRLSMNFEVKNDSGITTQKPILSPLKQFKSGVNPYSVNCRQDFLLVIKSEDNSPACVKPQTAQKLVERGWGWAMQTMDSLKPLQSKRITGLENDTGIVTLGNQTYYFETPNYTDTAYYNPVRISFHDVVFTLFPSGFRGGLPTDTGCEGTITGILSGSGSYYWTDAKFPDGIHELLHIFAYSKLSCPVHSIPTYFSTHTNPQAGLTFYDGKMKLLVSTDNQTSSALRLYLSTDSTYANPAEAVGVDISLNNTGSTPLILAKSDNWPRNDLSSGPCSNLPFGIAILKGYYAEQNMTGASSLVIYQNIPCPNPASIKSYTFQPLSSKATQECDGPFSCPVLADMKIHLKIDGFMDNNGQHRPFNVGTYTIVGGDEWGHVAIQHFTEAYATALAGVK